MEDKKLLNELKQLKEIKPRKDWVSLTKKEILGENPSIFSIEELILGAKMVLRHKAAFSSLVVLLVIIGTFGFAQNSMPGDMFFSIKKAGEKGMSIFASDKVERSFDIANKRLEELTLISHQNNIDKLAPAIEEYQTSVSETAESIKREAESGSADKLAREIEVLASKRVELEEEGVEIPQNESYNAAMGRLLKREVADLENRSLIEENVSVLKEVKELIEEGKLDQAFVKLMSIKN